MRASRAAAFAIALAIAAPAQAAPGDRDAARTLAGKGYELFEAKQYQRAIDLFHQAEARFHAPPHLLYIARAELKLGHMIEARRTYRRILDEKLAPDAPGPFKEAQTSARVELAEIEPLVPAIRVVVPGALPEGTRVLVDGEPVALGDLDKPIAVDPGAHKITGIAPGAAPVEIEVRVKAGSGEERVTLPIAPPPRPSLAPAIACFAIGAAGIGVGTTAAILLRNASGSGATNLRIAEIAGFAAGGAGVGVGVVLVALRARAPAAASVSGRTTHLAIGPGSLHVSGTF
jgi:hypothetical protein